MKDSINSLTNQGKGDRVSSLKRKIEKHFKNEISIMADVSELSEVEASELLEWIEHNPYRKGIKEVVDYVREGKRAVKKDCHPIHPR